MEYLVHQEFILMCSVSLWPNIIYLKAHLHHNDLIGHL